MNCKTAYSFYDDDCQAGYGGSYGEWLDDGKLPAGFVYPNDYGHDPADGPSLYAGTSVAQNGEGCGPDGCAVDLEGAARNAQEAEQLRQISEIGGFLTSDLTRRRT